MIKQRLERYFNEANRHIEHIQSALGALSGYEYISDYSKLSDFEKFALNTLIFRFSKLQDLIGSKIFRNYLEFSGFDTGDKSFFDILKEIEKEGIIDIDSWDELRKLRNQVAHDYPLEEDEVIESINLYIKRVDEIVDVVKKLEKNYNEINQKRDRDN